MTISIERKGMLVVLSAPSGGGKSTVLKTLRAEDPSLGYSVSATTRPPRGEEINGKDYHFITNEEFDRRVQRKEFYEWAFVHGNRYGTLRSVVDEELRRGHDVLLDIDVQGGLAIKKMRPDAVLIFLLPPSLDVLEQRLRGRKTDNPADIELRLRNARKEVCHVHDYDFAVLNDDLRNAVAGVRAVVAAERQRASRLTVLTHGEDIRIPSQGLFDDMMPEDDPPIATPRGI